MGSVAGDGLLAGGPGRAARRLQTADGGGPVGWSTLSVRVVEVDERSAKAAIHGLNSVGRRPSELEEAWLVQALVREDGLTQVEAAELLTNTRVGCAGGWRCLERLSGEAQAELRLGLLSPGLARQLTRLPVGNQAPLSAARRESLTMAEVQGVIDLLRGATPEQEASAAYATRGAVAERGRPAPVRDPRLSPAGNRLARQLGCLLDLLGRMENWQRHPGLAELKRDDRRLLAPRSRVWPATRSVADLMDDLWQPDSPDESP